MNNEPQNKKAASKGKSRAIRYLVGLLLMFTLVITGFGLYRNARGSNVVEGETQNASDRLVPVVTTLPVVRDFERVIRIQGNVEAKEFALITPRIPGVIEAVFVDEGDTVVEGQTRLFQIDKVKLEKTLEIRKHEKAVATCTVQEKKANLERNETDFEKAHLDYERFKRLIEKSAVTPDAFEQQESRYKQSQAMLKYAKAQLDLSTEQLHQAEAAFAIAEKDLADAVVTAPIDGKISSRFQEPGEMGSPGQPVVRIDNTSIIEVSAYLPAQYYNEVNVNSTELNIEVSGIEVNGLVISYKSPTINPRLRTFEIKGIIENPPEGVIPGAMAQIKVVLLSRRGLGVPSAAIQQRGGNNVVFVIEGNVSHQTIVQPGIETDGWTEIQDGQVNEGMAVVTMGQYMIEEGTRVAVQKEVE
jgi:multidrug efflux pump subunit AcrA (membrane-fusion protein)